MKTKMRFQIKESCNCCGICCIQYPDYFCENDEGKAMAKNEVVLLESEEVAGIEKLCPVHAITLLKEDRSPKQILLNMLEELKECMVKYPTKEDIPFEKEDYSIPIPAASGEYNYDYSSDNSANRAAMNEFDRRMYSQIDVIILKIITEYRTKYIKPYYSKSEEDKSVYLECNKKIEGLLEKIAYLLGQENIADDLPADFLIVNVFPDEDDITWKMLNKGELISDEMVSSIRNEFNSGSYSSLSDYESYWDTDDREVSAGTGFGGRIKYKDKYCYMNLREAFQELSKDILNACHYKSDFIVERAIETVKWLVDSYNKELTRALESDIKYIERKISSLS